KTLDEAFVQVQRLHGVVEQYALALKRTQPTSLYGMQIKRALEGRLWGVRLDTSEFMVDRSVVPLMGAFPPTGANPTLVWNVRNALDAEGFGEVKIVASGGFTVQRIRAFEEDGVPVDAYGVGASVQDGRWDFTADVVRLNGAPQAKAGRELRANARLERVK
ncbi:MAG: hypothetical protein ACJ8AD_16225, partial [Gemmatimonadaceae bacterium]